MSLHPRKQIRDAIVTALVGKTGAGERVYPSRVRPWREKLLPAMGVYLTSESADHEDSAPRAYRRRADIVVEIVAGADERLDDLLDAEAQRVENALLPDPELGGLVADLEMTGTEIELDVQGDTVLGRCAVTFAATYWTEPPEPVLDDFETAGVDWDLAQPNEETGQSAPDGTPEAEDIITMPTEEDA